MTASKDNPLRVRLINSTDCGGGAERVVCMLREGLADRGHDARLWVGTQRGDINSPDILPITSTPKEREQASRFARKGFFNFGIPSSVRFCASSALDHVDIIHMHNIHGHYFSVDAMSALAKRGPLVWTFHDYFPLTGGCAFPYDCDRWISQCGQCPQLGRYPIMTKYDRTRRMQTIKRKAFHHLPVTIVTPSEHLSRAVFDSGVFASADVHTIPYGVDTNIFQPAPIQARQELNIPQDRTVVMLAAQGLDDPRKGMAHAVEALKSLEVPNLTVLLIGGGDNTALIEALSAHDVRAMGYVTQQQELARCFAAADLFIFTSLAENYPCVVMEAMACGTAVLAFDIDGVVEQIEDGLTGFLVSTGNTQELASSAQLLLLDRNKLAEAGSAAHAYALDHWKMELFIDRHENLYREIRSRNTLCEEDQSIPDNVDHSSSEVIIT